MADERLTDEERTLLCRTLAREVLKRKAGSPEFDMLSAILKKIEGVDKVVTVR